MGDISNLDYNDFSTGQVVEDGELSSSLCKEGNIYLDLG